jgi:DNA-binding NtrC family response regulator
MGDKLRGPALHETGAPRVLVVDDDLRVARALSSALSLHGVAVTLAHDGRGALERLEEQRFDVLVLDLRMPGMDGIDVLRRASTHPNFPPTILHSAYLDVPTTVEAMRAGATEVLQKPVAAADLANRIRELSMAQAEKRASSASSTRLRAQAPEVAEASLLLGDSEPMRRLRDAVRRVARFRDISVLIEGPTGTGKELVAQTIHAFAASQEPLVCVNCAAIPAELFESELFGHEAGAFTSARSSRAGLLEEAGGGVLFLDEVSELPIPLQPKLLRVLETRQFRRVGSNRERRFEARVVSATNRSLSDDSSVSFRSDLYFRISGHLLRTPALCQHPEDIELLSSHFCSAFCEQNQLPVVPISDEAIRCLQSYSWPGNVRELRRVIESAVVHASSEGIDREQIEMVLGQRASSTGVAKLASVSQARRSLPELERDMIIGAYRNAAENLSEAARELGIPRTTLRDRLRRYGFR